MILGDYTVTTDYTVKQTIEKMEEKLIKAVIVVDENNTVLGLFSNGDMRSFFLKGGSLSDKISVAMNRDPVLFYSISEIEEERLIRERVIYPIVDSERHLLQIIDYEKQESDWRISNALKDVPLIIMAGGKGTRLYPYTKILPKPLIPIGDLTITERIISSFQRYGCERVIMILNHKAGMIQAYMGELKKEYKIEFVKEEKFQGTAGGLKLIKDKVNSTFFLSNCDIIINDDLECAYRTHKMKKNKITFICSMKDVVIPYGVVETDVDGQIQKMSEKPNFSYLVNTGVYVVEPEVIDDIRDGEFIHMPDLAQRYRDKGERVGVFPISEQSWMDMGQYNEMMNMMQKLGI